MIVSIKKSYALAALLGLGFLASHSQAAICTYKVDSDWGSGYTATITIANNSSTAINGWNVSWTYNKNRIGHSWNAVISGNSPYNATPLDWNKTIYPGQSVSFGFQGNNNGVAAERPTVTGAVCGAIASSTPKSSVKSSITSSIKSSIAPSSKSSSVASSRIAPSSIPGSSKASSISPSSARSSLALSSVRSSVAPSSKSVSSSRASSSAGIGLGNWQLNATESHLNFVTTKNTSVVEVHKFNTISGSLTNAGVATLMVDLASVNTTNTLRDQRLRDLFFQTGTFPTATATFNLNASVLSSIQVGKSATVDLAGTLDLHGVTGLLSTNVLVHKLSNTRVVVQSLAPVIVRSVDYNLVDGVEALRAAVGIASVSGIAPVDFVLVFNAQ